MRIFSLSLLALCLSPSLAHTTPPTPPNRVDYFPLPYATSPAYSSYNCSNAPSILKASKEFLACTAGGLLSGKNAGRMLCACLDGTTGGQEESSCKAQSAVVAAILCSQTKDLCSSLPEPYSLDRIAIQLPPDEINFSSLSPLVRTRTPLPSVAGRLTDRVFASTPTDTDTTTTPLPINLPSSTVAAELPAYYIGYRAAIGFTLLADNAICFSNNNKDALAHFPSPLPGWQVLQVVVPVPIGSGPSGQAAQCLVLRKDNEVAVVFRSSQFFFDWLADIDSQPVKTDYYPGLTHRGFTTFALGILPKVEAFLDSYLEENNARARAGDGVSIDRMVVIGHSLGSFVSRLAAFRLSKKYTSARMQVFGLHFAGARAGDTTFQDAFSETVDARGIDYELDAVPAIPCGVLYGCPAKYNPPFPSPSFEPWYYAEPRGMALIKKLAGGAYFAASPPQNFLNVFAAHTCAYECWTNGLMSLKQTLAHSHTRINATQGCTPSTCSVYVSLKSVISDLTKSASPALDGDANTKAEDVYTPFETAGDACLAAPYPWIRALGAVQQSIHTNSATLPASPLPPTESPAALPPQDATEIDDTTSRTSNLLSSGARSPRTTAVRAQVDAVSSGPKQQALTAASALAGLGKTAKTGAETASKVKQAGATNKLTSPLTRTTSPLVSVPASPALPSTDSVLLTSAVAATLANNALVFGLNRADIAREHERVNLNGHV